jgi:hypothetical protein
MIVIGILLSILGALAGLYIFFAALSNSEANIIVFWAIFIVIYFFGYLIVRKRANDNTVSKVYGVILILYGALAGLLLSSYYMYPLFQTDMLASIWIMFLVCIIGGVAIYKSR